MNFNFLKDKITMIFGLPGSGKTTVASSIVSFCAKKGYVCFSNFSCKGSFKLPDDVSSDDFPEGSWLIIDEAGLKWGNRDFKSFSRETIEFFKLYRHHRYTIILLSQSVNDCDLKIRRLVSQFFEVRRSLIPKHSKLVRWLRVTPQVDKKRIETTFIAEDELKVYLKIPTFLDKHFFCKRYDRSKYYKLFNSYDYIPTERSVKLSRW